ncbi:proline dehydrogenase family protein [Chloroflexota bacterium]
MKLTRSLFSALARSRWLRDLAVGARPARSLSRRFVAGERLDEAIAVARVLNEKSLYATLDHLGENVTSETEARDATIEVLELLDGIESEGVRSGVSIKLTQLGLDLSPSLALDNLERIVAHAAALQRFVRIDMENHSHVQITLDLFHELWRRYRNLGVVIQSYLYRSIDDITRLIEVGASVRLVKGAYDEPAEVAHSEKDKTDAAYVLIMEQLFSDRAASNATFPAIATHDPELIDWAKDHTNRRGIPPESFEFQMLYGVRVDLQRQLVAEGYRVRAYVPYGSHWYPYLMRRMAERPANIAFLLRNLSRG